MSKINLDAIQCKKKLFQVNRLSLRWGWGRDAAVTMGVNYHLPSTAARLQEEADRLASWACHHDELGEPGQAGQLRRSARQIEALAERIRSEAGTAEWLSYDNPVVDLADARPVAAR